MLYPQALGENVFIALFDHVQFSLHAVSLDSRPQHGIRGLESLTDLANKVQLEFGTMIRNLIFKINVINTRLHTHVAALCFLLMLDSQTH